MCLGVGCGLYRYRILANFHSKSIADTTIDSALKNYRRYHDRYQKSIGDTINFNTSIAILTTLLTTICCVFCLVRALDTGIQLLYRQFSLRILQTRANLCIASQTVSCPSVRLIVTRILYQSAGTNPMLVSTDNC